MTSNNIFESDCDAIVNTVNCDGIMGGGLAAQFRLRYPAMNEDYQHRCALGKVRPGRCHVWWDPAELRWLINFPTMDQVMKPAQYAYIHAGLKDLAEQVIPATHITSLAIPALGCGIGGLEWDKVEPLIHHYLDPLELRLVLYPPR